MDFSHKARWRSIFSRGMDALVGLLALAAIIPLISVIYMVVERGAGNFRWSMLWELPPAAGMEGGGFGNALLGTTTVRLKALE
jgi:phosphate transport system permease protein